MDARVFHLWDGEPRTEINEIWLSKKGHVVTADYSQVCYSDDARPVEAPSPKQEPFWKTSENPIHQEYSELYPWD